MDDDDQAIFSVLSGDHAQSAPRRQFGPFQQRREHLESRLFLAVPKVLVAGQRLKIDTDFKYVKSSYKVTSVLTIFSVMKYLHGYEMSF